MTYGLPVMVHVAFPASVPETLVEAKTNAGARKNNAENRKILYFIVRLS
jgi:hypothetical protein